jgi:outer membrane immunogenic protein
MRSRIIAFSAASALALAASAAVAQDQPFSGGYVGVTLNQTQGDFELTDAPLQTAAGSAFWGPFGGTAANSQPSFSVNGTELGLMAGYNFQAGSFVFGVEGDVAYSDAGGSRTIADRPAAGTNQFTTRLRTDVEYTATLRARAGVAMGNVLVYGTAGGAMSEVTFNRNYVNASFAELNSRDKQRHTGWTYGAGVEWAFSDRLSARAEYLRLDFDSQSYDWTYSDGTTAQADVDFRRDALRFGLAYRF